MAAGGAAAAAIIQAIKASGVIVTVEPGEFQRLLSRQPAMLVVTSEGGFLSKKFSYMTSYKGLGFFTKSSTALNLPGDCEVITAKRIWVP